MEGHASISTDILASYAADAAREVRGVRGLLERSLPGRRGVRVSREDGRVVVDLHLAVEWGASMPDVGRQVQASVRDYLARMAGVEAPVVNVAVDEVAAPTAR